VVTSEAAYDDQEASRRLDGDRDHQSELFHELLEFVRRPEPTNYAKSLKQLGSLLYLLGADVEVAVKNRGRRRAS